MAEQQTYYFPWYRKGLGNSITETDTLGNGSGSVLARPEVKVVTEFKAYGLPHLDENKKEVRPDPVKLTQKKVVRFVGPGDVLSVSPSAVMKVNPAPDSDTFPMQYFPYLEFWEPDFPWRYTPAAPDGNKLRPWLALVVCKSSDIDVQRPATGLEYFTFKGDQESFAELFVDPSQLYKTAHAQGRDDKAPDFSRIISLRKDKVMLEPGTMYTALLIPTFETGRLRGLGINEIEDVPAQAPAWESSMESQKALHSERPLDFPIYYKWTFRSASDSFDVLVQKLTSYKNTKSGIKLDVSQMGEGFDYDVNSKGRKSISMPAATAPLDSDAKEEPFPSPSRKEEKATYQNLKALLGNSPVFNENRSAIEGKAFMGEIDPGDDDPMVVPPVYGARHALATELESSDKTKKWVDEINLDIHNRAAAGLGKKVIQNNQEELVNRAWKQVEAVKALNVILYNRLVSMRANQSLYNKTVGSFGSGDQFIASMINYLSTMKNAGGDVSLSSIISDKRIPSGFASASFHNLTDSVARRVAALDETTLMENIVKNQTFKIGETLMSGTSSIQDLKKALARMKGAAYAVLTNSKSPIHGYSSINYIVWENEGTLYEDAFNPQWAIDVPTPRASYPFLAAIKEGKQNCGRSLKTLLENVCKNLDNLYRSSSITGFASPSVLWDFIGARKQLMPSEQAVYMPAIVNVTSKEEVQKRIQQFKGFPAGVKGLGPSSMLKYVGSSNVICLEPEEYGMLFGKDKLITKLGKDSKARYYVNIKVLTKKVRHGEMKIKDDTLFWIHALPSYVSDQLFEEDMFLVITDGRLSQTELSLSLLNFTGGNKPSLKSFDNYLSKTMFDGLSTSERTAVMEAGMKSDILAKIRDYLELPVSFAIDTSRLDDSICQTFEKPSDLMKFLETPKPGMTQLVKSIADLEKELESMATSHAAEAKEESQPAPSAEVEADVKQLSKEFNQKEAFARMKEVAQAYYSIFFSDTEVGKRLRDEYIDELLTSKYPIIAYPIFPEPTFHYLKLVDEGFVLPGAADIPTDTVSMVMSNPVFEEAYLCGMNTEMGQELLWREYPTDQRGSYFRKFWDSETDEKSISSGNYFDIKTVHSWDKNLGENHMASKDGLLIFAVKGKLMRLYPSTEICLTKAKLAGKGKVGFDDSQPVIQPVMQSFLNEDIFLVGFKTDIATLMGNPSAGDYGYILTFKENVEDMNFTCEKSYDGAEHSADVARDVVNEPSRYGKHISLFI